MEQGQQDGPEETAFRVPGPPSLMREGGLHCLCTRRWVALEELMKLSSQRYTETVTDGSWGEGRCWHMAHWAGYRVASFKVIVGQSDCWVPREEMCGFLGAVTGILIPRRASASHSPLCVTGR